MLPFLADVIRFYLFKIVEYLGVGFFSKTYPYITKIKSLAKILAVVATVYFFHSISSIP